MLSFARARDNLQNKEPVLVSSIMADEMYLAARELEELSSVARRIDASANVIEESLNLNGVDGWSVRVSAPGIPFLEARCADRQRARRLLLTSLIEHLFQHGDIKPIDGFPSVTDLEEIRSHKLRIERDARILSSFKATLEADDSEESIQRCIEQHPRLWRFATQGEPHVVPKLKLGEAFVTDFLVFGTALYSQTQTPQATFVELERPTHRLFTRSGDETAELRHGLRQLRDWKYWVAENRQYLRDRLVERIGFDWRRWSGEGQPAGTPPYGFTQQYLLVIGRRTNLTPDERLRLQHLNDDHRDFKIVTYDMLLDSLLPEAPWPAPDW